MPLITQTLMGATTTAASMVNRQIIATLGGGAALAGDWIEVNQMPQLRLYAVQTAGAVPAQVTLQMAVRNDGGGGVLNPLNLAAPTVMPAINVPLLLSYSFPCAFLRVSVTSGGAGTVLTLVYGASGP